MAPPILCRWGFFLCPAATRFGTHGCRRLHLWKRPSIPHPTEALEHIAAQAANVVEVVEIVRLQEQMLTLVSILDVKPAWIADSGDRPVRLDLDWGLVFGWTRPLFGRAARQGDRFVIDVAVGRTCRSMLMGDMQRSASINDQGKMNIRTPQWSGAMADSTALTQPKSAGANQHQRHVGGFDRLEKDV